MSSNGTVAYRKAIKKSKEEIIKKFSKLTFVSTKWGYPIS